MRRPGQAGPAAEYAPRRPETTTLYGVVQHHLETWLASARIRERVLPRFVERELRAFLDCGILANGFLRVHCDGCGLDRVVPFSCKGRGFCPSCGGRHMADTAAHLVDRMLPRVPVRQWVLSLPFGLRYRLAHDRELTAEVLRVFVRAVFASLRRRSRPLKSGTGPTHCGAVTFVQRFGGALNLNVHFHTLVLDGTYRPSEDDGTLRFHVAPPPETEELERVLQRVARGIVRAIERRGLGDEPDRLTEDDPLLAQLLAAAVQGRAATGPRAGQKVLRFGDRVEIDADGDVSHEKTRGLARTNGFSLHAGVAVPANDRQRLERLCRYVGRPPVATERMKELADGRLLYELRHPWKDGTTHVAFEPLELIDQLQLAPQSHGSARATVTSPVPLLQLARVDAPGLRDRRSTLSSLPGQPHAYPRGNPPADNDAGDLEVAGVADPCAADRPAAAGLTELDAGRTVHDAP